MAALSLSKGCASISAVSRLRQISLRQRTRLPLHIYVAVKAYLLPCLPDERRDVCVPENSGVMCVCVCEQ